MMVYFRYSVVIGLLIFGTSNVWAADAAAGKVVFEQVCTFCHSDDGVGKMGPALHGINQRRDAAWLDRWLQNPREMMKTDDYAKKLKAENKYNMTMPAIPAMKDDTKRGDVIAYITATF